MSRLTIEQLRFGERGPIDLTIERSECVSVSGSSGSGKTLLLRAIADLDPYEGRLFLDRREASEFHAPDWRRRVGLLPAESRFWFDTVRPHLPEPPPEWFDRLGLGPEILDWQVSRLSAGERQRVGLLRLLCNRPEVLLLDEPTARLDPENVQRMESLVTEYRRTNEAAVLWVSHDPEQVARISDRHCTIDSGQLREAGVS